MNNQQTKVRLGIVGCGKSAEVYQMPGLTQVSDIEIAAASDIDEGRLISFSNRYQIKKHFIDYHEMLKRHDIHAIAVLTPTRSHAEIASEAMSAGKHVFIDKPLALTIEDCERLIGQAAGSPGKITMVGFNLRWHRLVSRTVKLLQSGIPGHIKAIRSTYTHWHPGEIAQPWHRRREFGGGVLFNEVVHHFDLWRLFLKSEVSEVFTASNPSEYFEDETGSVTARFTNNTLASGIFSYQSSPNSEVEILGDRARISLALYKTDGLKVYSNREYPGDMKVRLRHFMSTIRGLPETIGSMKNGSDFDLTYRRQWQHFADSILRGASPACTLDDGKRAVQIALAAIKSASSGKPVTLK